MNINSVNTCSGNLHWIGIKCHLPFPEFLLYKKIIILGCVLLMLMINEYPKKTNDFFIDDVSHLVITTKMESQLLKLNTRFEVHNVVCSCF